MGNFEYKRLDESIKKEEVDDFLVKAVEGGWRIISFNEIPAHKGSLIRMQILLEREVPKAKAKRQKLFG